MQFKFDPEILDALQKVDDAKKFYTDTIKSVQETCNHPVIHYQKGYYSDIGGDYKSFVCCTSCGLTHFEHYGDFGPFGRRDDFDRPLQPKEMDYHAALIKFSLGDHHNKLS